MKIKKVYCKETNTHYSIRLKKQKKMKLDEALKDAFDDLKHGRYTIE